MEEEIKLTEEQINGVLDMWNSCSKDSAPSLSELIQEGAGFKSKDGRSKEGKAVKKFLASRKIKARASHEYVKQSDFFEFTEEQKELIRNNSKDSSGNEIMSQIEIARYITKNPTLPFLSIECRAVKDFQIQEGLVTDQPAEETGQYRPPKSQDRVLVRVNKYVYEGIDKENITSREKKELERLIGYLHTFRFSHQINTYRNETDRELFESSFIRYTYNKPDLTQEEVDQYIVLSAEVVISASIQRRVERLSRLLDDAADDTEGARISMGLVEAINTAQTEYNQCVSRQQKLLESLKEKRSSRLSKQIKESASILNLVQLWKDEESRIKLIKLAEVRKKALEKEVDKIASLDDIKAKIMGLTKDEVLNG
jgi:hypothetical protein